MKNFKKTIIGLMAFAMFSEVGAGIVINYNRDQKALDTKASFK